MAKDKLNLSAAELDTVAPAPAKKAPKKSSQKAKSQKPSFGKKIAKVFREMISELKKVDWPPLRRAKNNPGVLQNLGTVLIVVLFFMVIITAFDSGLGALLKLLTGISK
jgi:preprotein translocase, SecE subunit, bacterial